ncbi:23S rRNA (pseudouridine(1915)-N(3))-methyltransferase RlmH [Haliovirga abyssi]|uniref:Ribosomal RNA large subunit methyltransferase H n=1 Tax=Haliovirga abyssi TaxID=2996794 RepID=A0AAU9D3Q2_9FUSO|nr:23S rRNA (pseudouridine(1915)-N(3))-methyltransferase RlmH [Haliovirga abyssi]BDU50591.1 ribosomal RNA large subunit methyltransferase H [Haliovirga abyssi]
MNINLICVGKIKEKYLKDGILEYEKRLKLYVKTKIYEIKDIGNDQNRNLVKINEGKKIVEILNKLRGYTVLLDLDGKMFDSENFSKKIEKLQIQGNDTINFIIGGSYGVSEEVKKRVDLRLKFSDFTFPHQLMRLIFFEQLYRWFSILNNSKYHK